MSVAYEPRNFIHDGSYPPIGDDHDHTMDQRFTDSDVAEQLSHYTTEASLLPDDRGVSVGALGEDRGMMPEDAAAVQEATRLDLGHPAFQSPLQVAMQGPTLESLADDDLSPGVGSPPSNRIKPIPKPDRDVVKQADGKFHCPLDDCKEDLRAFARKCEWK